MSRESLANDIWRACDIMRRDDGTTGIMEYMEQISWMLFLKAFEDIENRYEVTAQIYERDYTRVIGGPYRWSIWTGSRRKRTEAKVSDARQSLNKANSELKRAIERLQVLKSGKDPDVKNGKKIESKPGPQKIGEIEQAIPQLQVDLAQAQENLKQAEIELEETLAWLKQQVQPLFDEQVVEQQVLNVINRQFGGRLDLMQGQVDLLRETERQRGRTLAQKLVDGIVGDDLLEFVDNQLFPYLRRLQGTPEQDVIASIFNETPGNRMRSAANLKAVIDRLDEANFQNEEDSQVVSQVYEDLLKRLGTEGGVAGEFYTPRLIIKFMIEVINPEIGETVYDPFVGSAGFLVEAYKHMVQHERTPEDHETLQRHTFYGQEKKPLPALLGLMNMILHGVFTPNIIRVNTLEKDDVRNIPPEARHHVILTNPPFGGKEGDQIQGNFPVQHNATELLALQHIIAKLRPNGRCGVVVPEGILFRGDAFAIVKQKLIQKYKLYAIISLPAGVFANVTSSGAGPKTNIMFFDGPGPTKQIWYYEIRQVGYTLTKAQRSIPENDLPDALAMLGKYREALINDIEPPLNERCWIIPIEQIIENNYDLSARNPYQTDINYFDRSIESIIADLSSKNQIIGDVLSELDEWLDSEKLLRDLSS